MMQRSQFEDLKMLAHDQLSKVQLRQLIKVGFVQLGGNSKLKIYGTLSCKSGKRMKKENRVFFKDEDEAIQAGYRPCGHCLREKYKILQRSHPADVVGFSTQSRKVAKLRKEIPLSSLQNIAFLAALRLS